MTASWPTSASSPCNRPSLPQRGTRNEDLLLPAELTPFVWLIRRVLANMNNTERAASALVKGLKATNSKRGVLIRSAKKAAQSEYVM